MFYSRKPVQLYVRRFSSGRSLESLPPVEDFSIKNLTLNNLWDELDDIAIELGLSDKGEM